MPKAPYLHNDVKEAIVRAASQGMKQNDIKKLFGVSQSAVSKILKRNKERGTVITIKKSGRPRKTTSAVDKLIVRKSKFDPYATASTINRELKEFNGINIDDSTVRRRLRERNLFGRIAERKPFVSEKNRKARLKFAKNHLHWTSAEWSKVLWSDESKFCLFGSDGRKYVRRPIGMRHNHKYQLSTVKHGGGNVMVWGCFSRDGVGPIVQIEEIMNGVRYREILEKYMLPYGNENMINGWIFQHDNDPKHKSKVVTEWLNSNDVQVLEWPAQSPDLNPIENLWSHVDCCIRNRSFTNKNEMMQVLREEWTKIPLEKIIKLVDSMHMRCVSVIKEKGFPTKY